MKLLLVIILAFVIINFNVEEISAEKSTYFDSVKFIQYLDENTALEEVRNGNLDLYYYRIPSDRLENSKAREGLNVFDSTSGSYSILVNPAETQKFNPFSIQEVRFALNYLVDRKLIVNELMSGYGAPMISQYGPFDPEYLTVIEQLEKFNFRYNPTLGEEIIMKNLKEKGAVKTNGKWQINESPIEIIFFIRSDDPVRKSIGEILASELERIGFMVKRDYGDLNKAFVIVYGSDPADLKWSIYTEGWAKSAFVKYDSVSLGQMYAPWFSNMPGFNVPEYWNYQNEHIDSLTQKIYTGDFKSADQREELIQQSIVEGVNESVRIFLASKVDQYVVNKGINGVVNDFGAGIPTRFTPINAQGEKDELVIGVKQIYQGSWNPIMGFSDTYSRQIWGILSDPLTFKHPFTGETVPIRGSWSVETAGPDGSLNLPDDAIIWDPHTQVWKNVPNNATATSKVTFDLDFSNWHNGQKMDMNDILHSLYFTIEWGTQTDENDKTFDDEFTPRAGQSVDTIIGVRPIDDKTIEVYVDYWHFDDGEIAEWASLWNTMPWEIFTAIEQAVIDGKVSISRSGASNKNINWVSLIIPNDARVIQNYLDEFNHERYVPAPLKLFESDLDYFENRYLASSEWITKNNHAVISNGPFYLNSYSPESRTITVTSFEDDSYPFNVGHWSAFEHTEFPKITDVQIPKLIQKENELNISIKTSQADSILYFLNNNNGDLVTSEKIKVYENPTTIKISGNHTKKLGIGANDLKIFAISNSVLKPDFYTTSFIVTNEQDQLPEMIQQSSQLEANEETTIWVIIPVIVIIVIVIVYLKQRK
ncbi:MAG: ABC transporter substrate-binding protein [Nitrosopumilus sp.]|nr:ABC transporter substrate-binding protein [Nitrosopumilus sp.]MDH3385276.1 ABC transporter substrate-binding protein [Nitrosopumilus sp.]